MNEFQLAHQIPFLLKNRRYKGDPAAPLTFNTVLLTGVDRGRPQQQGTNFPLVIIHPMGGNNDPSVARLRVLDWAFLIAVSNFTDALGAAALLGANRTDPDGSSEGAGLLELQEELDAVLNPASGADGLALSFAESTSAETATDGQRPAVAFRLYRYRGGATTQRVYDPPTRFRVTSHGSGSVALAWTIPTHRWDFFRVVVRRGTSSGDPAPSSVSGGTGVTLSSNTATSVVDTPGTGTWAYSVFAQFDEYYALLDGGSPAVATATSAADTVSGVTA